MTHFGMAATLTIREQHRAALACCQTLLMAIDRGETAQISDQRAQLAALLHANLAAEEAAFHSPIRRMPIASRPVGYAAVMAQGADLRAQYSAHIGRWSLRAIAAEPDGYARAVRILIDKVREHINEKQTHQARWKHLLAVPNHPAR